MMTRRRVHSRAVGNTSTTQKWDGLAVLRSRHIAYLSSFVLIMVSAAQLNDLSCLSYRKRKWAVLTSRASSFKFSLFMVTVYRGHTALHKIPASCEAWHFALWRMLSTFSEKCVWSFSTTHLLKAFRLQVVYQKNKAPVTCLLPAVSGDANNTADMQSTPFHMQNCLAVA